MAVLERIRKLFVPFEAQEDFEIVVPAPPTDYEIHVLTANRLDEICRLNRRCFKKGENYNKQTLTYLLSETNTLSYCMTAANNEMVAFIFATGNVDGTGHITTIGVAPEHRRRGLAQELLVHAEVAMKRRQISVIRLEVRVSNVAAQSLYRRFGYATVQRLENYYNNGEDGFLMVKSLF
ncbi:MAG TPA: ribosomal protein S18-alanine N-acetyltransferase [Pyrinomonadaceae bacterium]|jgi:ribosomal-protein-alanine N-acetyltransferase